MNKTKKYKVISVRNISKTAFVLRLERNGFSFIPGQCATVGIPEMATNREYSIYSGVDDNYLEFLIKEVEGGVISSKLRGLKKGDKLTVNGAYGLFNLGDLSKKYMLIATGTGIAPFHSMVKSFPKLDCKILHGIRSSEEEYDKDDYKNYVACLSELRVSGYLKKHKVDKNNVFYLCGNSEMINDVYDILREQGVNGSNIHSESFF